MEDGAKILIIQTAFIGDLVLTTPLIRALGRHHRLHVLVTPVTANLLHGRPDVERVVVYDKRSGDRGAAGMMRIVTRLRRERYDRVVSPHRSLRSALIAFLCGASQRVGFDNAAAARLYNRRIAYDQSLHEIERNLALAGGGDYTRDDLRPNVHADSQDREAVDRLLPRDRTAVRVAMAPGSVWSTKRWPLSYFQAVTREICKLGMEVVLVGGAGDSELCQQIKNCAPSSVINTAGQLTLRGSAELLRRCVLLLSNDSAPMHLSVAAHTPVIALFGPTVPEFGFAPSGERDAVLQIPLSCRPCGLHGGRRCPIGTHDCMNSIEPGIVVRMIRSRVA